MARINIEDDIECRGEFRRLLSITGGDWDASLGKLVRFFRVCQKRYAKGEVVPGEELRADGLECMITSGWAIPATGSNGDGFQTIGAQRQFDWYLEKCAGASTAGKASAKARKAKYGTAQPNSPERTFDNSRTTPERPPNEPRTSPNPLTPSLTLTPSLNTKRHTTCVDAENAAPRNLVVDSKQLGDKPNGKDMGRVIARYCEVFKTRYGARPDVGGQSRGEVIRLVKDYGVEKSCQLVEAYLQLSDKLFLTKCHDLTTLRMNVNRVGVALQTGIEDPAKEQAWNKTVREFMRDTEENIGTTIIHKPND